ncbi:uncharacterized protein LOC144097999 [Amblyomma americanum]
MAPGKKRPVREWNRLAYWCPDHQRLEDMPIMQFIKKEIMTSPEPQSTYAAEQRKCAQQRPSGSKTNAGTAATTGSGSDLRIDTPATTGSGSDLSIDTQATTRNKKKRSAEKENEPESPKRAPKCFRV